MYDKPFLGQIPGLVDIYMSTFGYKTNGYFVDIGAFDGIQWSNTHTLVKAGWSGLLVEPQPDMAQACRDNVSEYPGVVKVVEAAISSFNGEADLQLAGSLSTINSGQIRRYRDTKEFGHYFSRELDTTRVKVMTTNQLFADHYVPIGFDVMSIDVEGSELALLRSFAIGVYVPKLVLVEAHESWHSQFHSKATKINDYFERAGYEKIYSDHINNVYRRRSEIH